MVEIQRPPHNFFDAALIEELADCYSDLEQEDGCRVILLCSSGRNFCAGANFGATAAGGDDSAQFSLTNPMYRHAVRLFRCRKPVVAAIQGAAVGGGLGLAVSADFRVTSTEGRFSANFTKIGLHPGFGLTVTLPNLIGYQRAARMLLTSCRIGGEKALEWGLVDACVPQAEVRERARALGREIASCAPLAIIATRATLRVGFADRVEAQTNHELTEQNRLQQTLDWREGVLAAAERREPRFAGR